ncbi:hypothetical protein Mal48_23810 [Thalassoglobus polymorphus]|uniref:Uncharacterized protein n=1 Tax=Thalassoglobus polymorphus TaxID=2527994 RepID=A0A517QNB1_9PLAN|nr:hypothetical protein Mal48_23810 [Thalassoglobus polymorphus]
MNMLTQTDFSHGEFLSLNEIERVLVYDCQILVHNFIVELHTDVSAESNIFTRAVVILLVVRSCPTCRRVFFVTTLSGSNSLRGRDEAQEANSMAHDVSRNAQL